MEITIPEVTSTEVEEALNIFLEAKEGKDPGTYRFTFASQISEKISEHLRQLGEMRLKSIAETVFPDYLNTNTDLYGLVHDSGGEDMDARHEYTTLSAAALETYQTLAKWRARLDRQRRLVQLEKILGEGEQ